LRCETLLFEQLLFLCFALLCFSVNLISVFLGSFSFRLKSWVWQTNEFTELVMITVAEQEFLTNFDVLFCIDSNPPLALHFFDFCFTISTVVVIRKLDLVPHSVKQ